ncbi:SET domain-containing protein-lysine N-methyltransferase [Vibrio intestinalis]|uniref:SET domain-containing protein-lysine N-methyltransferase n=1 Tax=Vibrio intestinalis TaxID=2933291 RepID=UPI0021A2BA3A|nr:SET domain-containing protein [Vibrio intestinalis]
MANITQDIDFVRQATLDTISDTIINPSPTHGFGLFLTQSKSENTVIGRLDGQLVSRADYSALQQLIAPQIEPYQDYFFMECTYLPDDQLMVRSLRTKYSYINHHRQPNIAINFDTLELVTLRDIDKGEELLVDYRKEWLPDSYINGERGQYL